MSATAQEPIRVLVVDDDASIVRLIKSTLEKRSSKNLIVTGTTEPEYVRSLAAQNAVDICITDMDMPTVNGFKLLKQLKELDQLTQVIFMTAHPTLEAARSAFAMGVNEFLAKPIDLDNLNNCVQFLADRLLRLRCELFVESTSNG